MSLNLDELRLVVKDSKHSGFQLEEDEEFDEEFDDEESWLKVSTLAH